MFLPGKILIQKSEGRLGFRPIMSWSIAVLLGMLAVGPSARAADNEDDAYSRWYFTADEVEAAYQYQQNYGERLRAAVAGGRVRISQCRVFGELSRDEELLFLADLSPRSRAISKRCSMAARRNFFSHLDADHAHLGVPKEAWNQKYKDLPVEQLFAALVRDPGLVALYHTAEHLRVTDRKTGALNSDAKKWQDKRNVIGYFDGRPNKILPAQPNGQGASMPEEYYSYSGFTFLASPEASYFSRWVRAW